MRRSALAPAKVNLFLHVGTLDAEEGRHPVSSLMVFANIGDRVTIEPADHPEFVLDGPMSAQLLSASADENLVIRARDLVLKQLRRPVEPFRLTLVKSLPVASGLGGGSSDAGAALALIRDALDLPLDDKMRVAMPRPGYPYGYSPLAGETLAASLGNQSHPDLKQSFAIGPVDDATHTFADPDEEFAWSPNLWPDAVPELRTAWETYYRAMAALSARLEAGQSAATAVDMALHDLVGHHLGVPAHVLLGGLSSN